MKIYKLIVDTDNGFQAVLDIAPKELLPKDIYKDYSKDFIDCLILDLDKGKKITDVLNVGTLGLDGFPIKIKYYELLKKYNLLKIQFVDIIDKDLKDYKFMFFNSNITDKLDYQKCDFYLVEDMLGDITELDTKINPTRKGVIEADLEFCVEDIFAKLIPRNGYHFLPGFNINEYDVFRIGHFDLYYYVSERVKTELENNNITGVKFVEQPYFNME